MPMLQRRPENPNDLVAAIHQVRRRWRYKLMLRGAVGVLGLGALALALSAWGLESWRFTPASIITFRILLAVAVAALVGWFIVRPLLWRVSDEQVAMYLEGHEPSLQAEIVSAIEATRLAASSNSPEEPMHRSTLSRCRQNCRRGSLRSSTPTVAPCASANWMTASPIGPAPITSTESSCDNSARATACAPMPSVSTSAN